ncbi:Methyltransferase [Candidatus Paraburkholderia schumanniana]|nr:Methyltransferase [Candidatus Paraburkholderia schumannianae]
MIAHADANYIAHDYLARCNTPCYFVDFAGHADAQRMTYLAEAEPATMFAVNYGDDIARPLVEECGGNQVLLEQYLDFIADRSFRASLLVHGERRADIRYHVDEARLRALHVAASLTCADAGVQLDQSPQSFRTPAGAVIVVDHPVWKAAALALTQAAPFTMSFDQLRDAVRKRTGEAAGEALDTTLTAFIEAIVVRGLGRYRLGPVARSRANPWVSEAARNYPAHLSEGQVPHTFNVWHEPVVLNAAGQLLLSYIDGKRSRAELLVMLEQGVKQGLSLGADNADAVLDRLLRGLCA